MIIVTIMIIIIVIVITTVITIIIVVIICVCIHIYIYIYIYHCSGPVCTRSKSNDSRPRGKRSFLLCAKGESGVATVEAARKHAH